MQVLGSSFHDSSIHHIFRIDGHHSTKAGVYKKKVEAQVQEVVADFKANSLFKDSQSVASPTIQLSPAVVRLAEEVVSVGTPSEAVAYEWTSPATVHKAQMAKNMLMPSAITSA